MRNALALVPPSRDTIAAVVAPTGARNGLAGTAGRGARNAATVAMGLMVLANGRADATTLSQTSQNTIAAGNSISCSSGGSGFANGYLRRFHFADYGISTGFVALTVSFGVEQATSPTGSQPLSIDLFKIAPSHALLIANLIPMAHVDMSVANGSMTFVQAPVLAVFDAASAQDLVVEVVSPDGHATGSNFLMGTNSSGESRSGYLVAPECAVPQPTTFTALGYPAVDIVLNVSGGVGYLGVPDPAGDALTDLVLEAPSPNPSPTDRLLIDFELPSAEAARLELLDVAGRQWLVRDVGRLGIGRHRLPLGNGSRIPAGLYFVRLTQGGRTRVVRAALLR